MKSQMIRLLVLVCFMPAVLPAQTFIGVESGGTDPEMRFTLRTVRCIGCCALAPAMRIDGVTFGKMRLDKVPDVLEQFE